MLDLKEFKTNKLVYLSLLSMSQGHHSIRGSKQKTMIPKHTPEVNLELLINSVCMFLNYGEKTGALG